MADHPFTIRKATFDDHGAHPLRAVHQLDAELAAPTFWIEARPTGVVIDGTTRELTASQVQQLAVELRMAAHESARLKGGDPLAEYEE